MKNTRKIIVALLVLVTMLMSMTAIVASADGEEAPKIGEFWASDGSLYTVTGQDPVNIKYSGAGNSYACAGANIAAVAAGNDTFTATVTNNGEATSHVRFDIQCGTQVGNHKICNVSATGADGIWTDTEWGGSHFDLAAGATVTITITYDENTERGAVVDLVIFVDSCTYGDTNTYNADITISNMAFSNSKAPAEPKPEAPKTHVLESKDLEKTSYSADNSRVSAPDSFFTLIFKNGGKVDDAADEVTFADGYKATRRINFGGKLNVNSGVVNKSAIEITTDGPVNVKVWWVCGSSDNERYIGIVQLVDGKAKELAATEKGMKGTPYIDTLAIAEAGTYYIAPLGNGSYIYKVEVSPVGAEPACEHEYMFSCDQHCMKCGELTNPDAAHTIKHVDAVAPTCVAMGNVEYWYCEVCGSAWTDEDLTQVTNAMSVKLPVTDHYYYYNICAICYAPNPYFVANNVVAGENKLVVNQYHLVANGEGEHGHPYEFPYFTVTEAGRYTFTCDKYLTVFVYTTPVTAENADIWASGGAGWNVFDYDGEVDLQPGLYFVGFIYLEDQGEYNLTITKSEIPAPHEHNFVEGKCECGESDPNYVPPHEHKFEEGKCACGAEDPNYVAPEQPAPEQPAEELGFFQMILKVITEFFAKIANFFKGLFAK